MKPGVNQRIAIFGATSAIAQAAARRWAARGASLVLVGRNAGKLQALEQDLRVRHPAATVVSFPADLDRLERHAEWVGQAEGALGALDAVLVAYGSLPDQVRCQQDLAYMLAQLTTNGLSPISLCSLFAQRFQAQGHGCLAVITSVAGDRGRQSNYVYATAKGMVSRFLEGLRNRLAAHGVAVVDIRPGFVDTPMTAALDKKGPLWAQPDTIAAGIVGAMYAGRDIVYLPGYWRWIMAVIRHIPERVFKHMKL